MNYDKNDLPYKLGNRRTRRRFNAQIEREDELRKRNSQPSTLSPALRTQTMPQSFPSSRLSSGDFVPGAGEEDPVQAGD